MEYSKEPTGVIRSHADHLDHLKDTKTLPELPTIYRQSL